MSRRFTTDWSNDVLRSWKDQTGILRIVSTVAPRDPHDDPLREASVATESCGVRAPRGGSDDPLLSGDRISPSRIRYRRTHVR